MGRMLKKEIEIKNQVLILLFIPNIVILLAMTTKRISSSSIAVIIARRNVINEYIIAIQHLVK
jgi:hypothetical protein